MPPLENECADDASSPAQSSEGKRVVNQYRSAGYSLSNFFWD